MTELRRAVVLSECDPIGRPIKGTAKLAQPWLEQNEYWRTRDGRLLKLEDMEVSHRANVIHWLERHAYMLMLRYDAQLASGPLVPQGDMASLDFDRWLEEEWQRDPVDRIRETAMYKRLVYLNEQE